MRSSPEEKKPSHESNYSKVLPICADCKKIRDERETWHQLETYFTAHSNMTFIHGIGPECEKQAMARFKREQFVQ